MHGIEIEQIAGHHSAPRPRNGLARARPQFAPSPHCLPLLQQQFGDRASYRPHAARQRGNQNGRLMSAPAARAALAVPFPGSIALTEFSNAIFPKTPPADGPGTKPSTIP